MKNVKKNAVFVLLGVMLACGCEGEKPNNVKVKKTRLEPQVSKPKADIKKSQRLKTTITSLADLRYNLELSKRLLASEKNTKTRFQILSLYPQQARAFANTLKLSDEHTQAYLLQLNQSKLSERAKIRSSLKDRRPVHDKIDALANMGMSSECIEECSRSVLSMDMDGYYKALPLTKKERRFLDARDYCNDLHLDEGYYFGVDVGLFTKHLNLLNSLQKDEDKDWATIAMAQEKNCWNRWLSLCTLESCEDVNKTLPALSESFPHMKKVLREYEKMTQKTKEEPDNLKEMVEKGFSK